MRTHSGPFKNCQKALQSAGAVLGLALVVGFLSGCTAPMGADKVRTQQAYAQVNANALRNGKPSASTISVLHRFNLDELAARRPDEAVRQLHEKALATGDRNLLFALAEMSYVAGRHINRNHSVQPWDPRDARDYYLGSAVYAWMFLFGDGNDALPSAFDRRFREACDYYNIGLGLALTGRRSTNAVIKIESGRRRLPVGEIDLTITPNKISTRLDEIEEVLLADRFRVRGLSVRNRDPGLGTPLIGVLKQGFSKELRRAKPGTLLLRVQGSLADLASGRSAGALEIYSPYDAPKVAVGPTQVPLEFDLTASLAYTLNQATVWKLGRLEFLAPAELIPSQLILTQPFEPDRIPLVLVHGTFSSPVTWAEMANTLTSDPVLRRRYQIWMFMYGSGKPLVNSIADLRAALTTQVQQLDPEGTNTALQQMVVIGHSQGGLLTKSTAVETGDLLWRTLSTNRLEDLKLEEKQRETIRRMAFLEPLPFVKRVVFIATPHQGSYQIGGILRGMAHRMVSLPASVLSGNESAMDLMKGSEIAKFLNGKLPTSLDGMSPKNPGLIAMAGIPVRPPIQAHSIVAINGADKPPAGADGVVKYSSAHVDYAKSELIVRSFHTCLEMPETIEEVRRILHLHLKELPVGVLPSLPKSASTNAPTNQPANP